MAIGRSHTHCIPVSNDFHLMRRYNDSSNLIFSIAVFDPDISSECGSIAGSTGITPGSSYPKSAFFPFPKTTYEIGPCNNTRRIPQKSVGRIGIHIGSKNTSPCTNLNQPAQISFNPSIRFYNLHALHEWKIHTTIFDRNKKVKMAIFYDNLQSILRKPTL